MKPSGSPPALTSLDALLLPGRVAAVLAHPDDETFCSGLLAELAERGSRIEVHCLTRGEGGPTGGLAREVLGAAREEEMREACGVLGIAGVHFLDLIDPLPDGSGARAPEVAVEELADRLVEALEPADWVLSHGSDGEYRHPAHLMVFGAVRRWHREKADGEQRWVTFSANNPEHPLPRFVNAGDAADLVLDVSRHREKRIRALASHRTQRELFARFAGGEIEDFVEKTSLEAYCFQGAFG